MNREKELRKHIEDVEPAPSSSSAVREHAQPAPRCLNVSKASLLLNSLFLDIPSLIQAKDILLIYSFIHTVSLLQTVVYCQAVKMLRVSFGIRKLKNSKTTFNFVSQTKMKKKNHTLLNNYLPLFIEFQKKNDTNILVLCILF